MSVGTWTEEVLGARSARDRIAHALPVLKALEPRWEAVWRELWSDEEDEAERSIEVGREALAALERHLEDPGADEHLDRLCEATDAIAADVGENGQQLDDFDDAGFAHAFTALLTVCLYQAAGEPHPQHSFEEVVEGMASLIEMYPAAAAAFR